MGSDSIPLRRPGPRRANLGTPSRLQGGVVGITIDWNCDLDWPVQYCKPVYQFHGLYNDDSNVSPGFNFR